MLKTPVAGVRFEPGGDANPLVWVMHVDAPVSVFGGRVRAAWGSTAAARHTPPQTVDRAAATTRAPRPLPATTRSASTS